jgi:hypothetical protein
MSARYASKSANVFSAPGGVFFSDAGSCTASLASRHALMRSSHVAVADDLSKPI